MAASDRVYRRTPQYQRAEALLRSGAVQVDEADFDRVRLDVGERRIVCTWTAEGGYRCGCGRRDGGCSHVAVLRIVVLARQGRDRYPEAFGAAVGEGVRRG